DLPWPSAPHLGERAARPHAHLLALERNRCEERRRPLLRQAGRRGWQPHHVAQAGRRAGVQRGDYSRLVESPRVKDETTTSTRNTKLAKKNAVVSAVFSVTSYGPPPFSSGAR